MRKIAFLMFGCLVIFCSQDIIAQNDKVKSYRNYGTLEVMKRLQQENPKVLDDKKRIEYQTAQYIRRGFLDSTIVLKVPIVFHVIQSPEMEPISQESIVSQIEALNRDFGEPLLKTDNEAMSKEGFVEKATSVNITFCLPAYDPYGRETAGINYHQTSKAEWTTSDAIKNEREGGINTWDTKRYLNIYIADLENSLTGYAQMPGGPLATDGIVIDYKYFGVQREANHPFNMGKTLTHLVGNYLNLYPLWGQGHCEDDYVFDTPIHNAPNIGCSEYQHVSTCYEGRQIEMTMNFMDASNDECQFMFTHGQKRRIEAAFAKGGAREQLLKTETICDIEKKKEDSTIAFRTENETEKKPPNLEMSLFPNPAKDEINLIVKSEDFTQVSVLITDVLGKKYFEEKFNCTGSISKTINCQSWTSGMYYLRLREQNGSQRTKTFHIQH